MSEVPLTEQLDQAIEALLRNPGKAASPENVELAELLNIACS